MSVRDVTIIGAGPAGLSAAIAAKRRGLDYLVLEKGVLVNSIFNFPTHMVFFTTPELLEVGDLPFISPYEKPTRLEALRYYRRVAEIDALQVELGVRVCSVERNEDDGTFRIETSSEEGSGVGVHWSRAVIVAIGYFDHPNLLGIPGEDLPHVRHYYREAHPFWRRDVVVVGGANSAVEAALELHRAGARVTIVHRGLEFNRSVKYWVLPDMENRIKEGSIAARMKASPIEIRPGSVTIAGPDGLEDLAAEAVFLLTGYRADAELLRAAGVDIDLCTWLPSYDPETFESNVPNLFLAGGVVCGTNQAPVFIENGRFHGPKAVEVIVRRLRGQGLE